MSATIGSIGLTFVCTISVRGSGDCGGVGSTGTSSQLATLARSLQPQSLRVFHSIGARGLPKMKRAGLRFYHAQRLPQGRRELPSLSNKLSHQGIRGSHGRGLRQSAELLATAWGESYDWEVSPVRDTPIGGEAVRGELLCRESKSTSTPQAVTCLIM